MGIVDNFRAMLEGGQDSPLLRFSLALRQDPEYSAAWKLYGKALQASDDSVAAIEAYERGIVVAERKGDKQAAKEMTVFLKRLRKHG